MDKKKRTWGIMLLIALALSAANIATFYYKASPGISGMAIKEFPNLFSKFDFSLIAFLVQWVIIILILIFSYVKFLKKIKEDKVHVNYVAVKTRGRGTTEIDSFYSLLKDKKHLKLPLITKIFKIDKEKALEWSRILETHNLVTIEYPAFSDPVVEIKE